MNMMEEKKDLPDHVIKTILHTFLSVCGFRKIFVEISVKGISAALVRGQ
jgi:hypothetical protein